MMGPVTRSAASSATTNEDGANQASGDDGARSDTRSENEVPSDSTTPQPAMDMAAVIQAAVQAAVREAINGMALLQTQQTPATPVTPAAETSRLVPSFDPLSSGCSTVDTWIRRVDDLADIYGWSVRLTSCNALCRLEGPAKTWYDSLSSVDKTWVQWKDELKRAFPSTSGMQRLHREMEARCRKRGEPIESYYYDKLAKARRCNISDKGCVEYIITGLNDPDTIRAVSVRTYDTPEELLHCLKRLEDRLGNVVSSASRQNAKHFTDYQKGLFEGADHLTKATGANMADDRRDSLSRRQRKKPLSNEKGEPLCFNCNEYGHLSLHCPSPQRKARCGACGRVGHETRDCRAKKEREPRVAQNVVKSDFRATEAVNEKYFMPAKLNGHEIRAYVDLGSQCVTLRQEDAERLEISYTKLKESLSIGGYGSGCVTPCGEASATITVDQATADVHLYVVPSSSQSIPLLVGQPFTEQPHVTIVRRRQTVRIFEERENVHETDDTLRSIEIPDLPQRSVCLWAKESTVVPPKYVGFVKLYATGAILSTDVFVDAQFRCQEGREHCIPRCVVTVDEAYETRLPIMNMSNHDLDIKEHERVARAEICYPDDMPEREINVHVTQRQPMPREEIKTGPAVTPHQRKMLECLIDEYRDCFARNISEIGQTSAAEMKIELTTDELVRFRPYRLSFAERAHTKEMIEELKQAGIVVDSTSDHASPILLVRKKKGELRICVDYRALNRVTKKDRYPLPLIDDQLYRLRGKCFFTSLDLASGYYQTPMEKESRHKTAFVTPDGHYEFVRMPFGLANAPAVFQRMINAVLGPLRYSVAVAYMDDILLPTTTVDEGLEHLRKILEALRRAGLTLRLSKCYFFCDRVDCLGYDISAEGVQPGTLKLQCVAEFPKPTNVHEVRRFLGLASYFRRFVKGFATIAKPLTKLTSKDKTWKWTAEQDFAFAELKKRLIEKPILAHFSFDARTEVHTDASRDGLGAILLQEQAKGQLHPVVYASRRTTECEERYHSYELETLAVVWALEKFRFYLIGLNFKVVTDCNAVRRQR
ncbi:uncharacterized protein LOC144146572 [Haemaphysalis longicornis]